MQYLARWAQRRGRGQGIVNHALSRFGSAPDHIDYPRELHSHLSRSVWDSTYNDIGNNAYAKTVIATVPATMSARPREALRVSRSPRTSHANATDATIESLSICTTALTTPVCSA